eukprot:2974654-Amphidinium_carterae.1
MTLTSGLESVECESEMAQKNIRSLALQKDAAHVLGPQTQHEAAELAKQEHETARPLLEDLKTKAASDAKKWLDDNGKLL